ncbi:unnamed protein product, partial [marine sediment metagenome]
MDRHAARSIIAEEPDAALWHRQQGETSRSYQLFCVYLELLPGVRVLRRTRELVREGGRGISISRLKALCSTWTWVARAAAYD